MEFKERSRIEVNSLSCLCRPQMPSVRPRKLWMCWFQAAWVSLGTPEASIVLLFRASAGARAEKSWGHCLLAGLVLQGLLKGLR